MLNNIFILRADHHQQSLAEVADVKLQTSIGEEFDFLSDMLIGAAREAKDLGWS